MFKTYCHREEYNKVAISSVEIATPCGLAMTELFCSTVLNFEYLNLRRKQLIPDTS